MLVREARPVLTPPRPAAPRAAEAGPVDRVDLSTVPVSHQRELRGAWVASIWNLNFPSRPTLPTDQQNQGIVGVFRDELYKQPALTPPIARTAAREVSPPTVEMEGRTARLAHTDGAPLRAWTVYKETITAPGWELDRIVPASQSTVELQAGNWAIAAATRNGNESRGVVVSVISGAEGGHDDHGSDQAQGA